MSSRAETPAASAAKGGFDYDALPAGYYDQVFHRRRGVQSKWHHLKFAQLRRGMAGLRDHLDIGCGPGTFIATLPEGHRSVGIDIAAPQIAHAETRYATARREFRVVEPGPLPFADESFDVVTLVELIEHLPDEQNRRLLAEARRVLRPGGRLLASTPNYASLWPALELLVDRLGRVPYRDQHITHYTRGRLSALLEAAGFADVRVCGYMLAAPFAAALGWRIADLIARLEPAALTDRFGLLLLASGSKAR